MTGSKCEHLVIHGLVAVKYFKRKVKFMAKKKDPDKAYWHAILKMLAVFLTIWAVVTFLVSIIFVESLNTVSIGGYPLGFWFAQQGSIYIYIALIFIYIAVIGRIDKKYDVHENEEEEEAKS